MKYLFVILLFPSVCYALFSAKEAASQVAKVRAHEQRDNDRQLSKNVDDSITEAISVGSCNTDADAGNASDKALDLEMKKLTKLGYVVKSYRTKIDKHYFGTINISWCEDK
jgi:hypothetical protein